MERNVELLLDDSHNMFKELMYRIIKFSNTLVIKKSNYLLFSSTPYINDNAIVLFNYLYEEAPLKYKYIWVLQDDIKVKNKDNIIYIKKHSLKGIYYFFRSKYIFHTHGLYMNATSSEQIVFSLWHGMPLKKIQHLFPKDLTHIANRNFSFYCTVATSSLMQQIVADCFACPKEKVKITGLPRNDYLFKKLRFETLPEASKIIVWMPTYRNGNNLTEGKQYEYGLPIIDSSNLDRFNEYCAKNNVHLLIKFHPFQMKDKEISGFSNIHVLSSSYVDTSIHFYNYLGSADALITDYSSVYIDFLAVDKPIAFILEDYEEYNDDRGFVFDDPIKYMPGSHIYNLEELETFIQEIANGIDSTKSLRDTVGVELNQFRDDKNTERLVNEIMPILLKDGK